MRLLAKMLLVVALACLSRPALADLKIAVVDTRRCVLETEDGLRAQHTLKKLFDRRQKELDRRQQELARERGDLEKQARFLSKASLQRRMEHWQRRMVEVQTLFFEYQKELQKRQAQLTDPVMRKLFGVIKRIASGRGVDVVVDKMAVPYARVDLELTDMVIQAYNSGGAGDAPSDDTAGEPGAPKTGATSAPAATGSGS